MAIVELAESGGVQLKRESAEDWLLVFGAIAFDKDQLPESRPRLWPMSMLLRFSVAGYSVLERLDSENPLVSEGNLPPTLFFASSTADFVEFFSESSECSPDWVRWSDDHSEDVPCYRQSPCNSSQHRKRFSCLNPVV